MTGLMPFAQLLDSAMQILAFREFRGIKRLIVEQARQ